MDNLKKINEIFSKQYQEAHPKGDMVGLTRHLHTIATAFMKFDADGSGDMDIEEVGNALGELRLTRSKAEIKAAIRRVDDDDSGSLRYWEFVNLILMELNFLESPLQGDSKIRSSVVANIEAGLAKQRRRNGAVKKKKRGDLQLKIDIEKGSKDVSVSITILNARNLLPADLNGLADPYVKLYILPDPQKKTKQKTKVVKKSLDPEFNEKFTWRFPSTTDLKGRQLSVQIWDWDRISKNDFMGAMTFDLHELLDPAAIRSGWFILLDENIGASANFPVDVPTVREPRRKSVAVLQDASVPVTKGAHISANDFTFIKVLGRGSFGKVFLAENKADKKIYAVKVLKKLRVVADDDVEATITEKRILALPENPPFLIHLYASFQDQQSLFFVMEFLPGGDMMFHCMKNGAFSEKATAFYTAEISQALLFLHEKGIFYRDLKLDNVFMDREGHIRLGDFGLCKVGVPDGGRTQTFCGTPNYLAPEVVTYKPYTKAVDWWSLGVVMYEMLNGTVLFDGDTEDQLFASILAQPISLPRTMSKDARDIVNGFLTRDPTKRLGQGPTERRDIEGQAFFKTIDWAALQKRAVKPPFAPKLKNEQDTSNFEEDFTSARPIVTPADATQLATIDQEQFAGFTFVDKTLM